MADDTQKDLGSPERPEKYDGYKIVSGYETASMLVPLSVDMEALRQLRLTDPIAAREQAIDALKQMKPIPLSLDDMNRQQMEHEIRYATPQFWISTNDLTPTQIQYLRELLRRFGVGESTSDMEQVDLQVDGTFVYNEDNLDEAMEAMDKMNMSQIDNAVDKLTELSPNDMIRPSRDLDTTNSDTSDNDDAACMYMENNSDG